MNFIDDHLKYLSWCWCVHMEMCSGKCVIATLNYHRVSHGFLIYLSYSFMQRSSLFSGLIHHYKLWQDKPFIGKIFNTRFIVTLNTNCWRRTLNLLFESLTFAWRLYGFEILCDNNGARPSVDNCDDDVLKSTIPLINTRRCTTKLANISVFTP